MIYATFISNDEGYIGFNIIGHAMSGPAGSDLVCCAVSVLAQNTVNSIEAICNLKPRLVTNEQEGLMDVMYDSPLTKDAKVLMESFVIGMETLTKQYESYISLNFRRC